MSRRLERSPLTAAVLLVLAHSGLCAPAARAHNGPAEAPDFGTPDCISVVDIRTTPVLTLEYSLAYDDVMGESGHIKLDDSKTHQFFAFRGQVVPYLPDYRFLPFDPAASTAQLLPLWLNADDLARAAAANTPEMAPDFHSESIGDDVLAKRSDLRGQWQTIADAMRVPITVNQARRGLRWDVHALAAGVYQVVGYVFSPPYNAWEPRPGVIKIIDGVRDVPAVTVDSIDGSLFGGQGRKITGCVNAPKGSELKAWYRLAGDASAPWQLWAAKAVQDNGRYEFCYKSPKLGLSGLVEVRVGASAASGDETVAYAPDQLALVGNEAPCTANDKVCCEMAAPAKHDTETLLDAGVVDAGSDAGHAVMAPSDTPAVARPDLAAPAATSAPPPDAAPAMTQPHASSGCALSGSARSGAHGGWTMLMLMLVCWRAGRRRRLVR